MTRPYHGADRIVHVSSSGRFRSYVLCRDCLKSADTRLNLEMEPCSGKTAEGGA